MPENAPIWLFWDVTKTFHRNFAYSATQPVFRRNHIPYTYMKIIHILSDFLYSIFPEVPKGDQHALLDAVKQYYTLGDQVPTVSIDGGAVVVELSVPAQLGEKVKFKRAVSFCELGDYDAARPLLEELIAASPAETEYYRVLGQLNYDEGDFDAAMDHLIESLRWNPENVSALIMMGNLFAKDKKDMDTALTFYQQVLKVKADDHIALYNIGTNLLQSGRSTEARVYFEQALSVNPDYPNTHYGLGQIHHAAGEYREAFERGCKSLSLNPKRDELFRKSLSMVMKSAQAVQRSVDGKDLVTGLSEALSSRTGVEIRLETDQNLVTPAKIEFAENYSRNYHLVKYRPNYAAVDHLILHELMHLELVQDAQQAGNNMLFTNRGGVVKSF